MGRVQTFAFLLVLLRPTQRSYFLRRRWPFERGLVLNALQMHHNEAYSIDAETDAETKEPKEMPTASANRKGEQIRKFGSFAQTRSRGSVAIGWLRFLSGGQRFGRHVARLAPRGWSALQPQHPCRCPQMGDLCIPALGDALFDVCSLCHVRSFYHVHVAESHPGNSVRVRDSHTNG